MSEHTNRMVQIQEWIKTYLSSKKNITSAKGALLYEGKAKRIYEVPHQSHLLIQEFKDSLTAFNGEKKASLAGKGQINRQISTLLFEYLEKKTIPTHSILGQDHILFTEKLEMIPLEVVVRNTVAGSLKKRLGLKEGESIMPPLIELYFKSDPLKDPLINEDHAFLLKTTDSKTLKHIKSMALNINQYLITYFALKKLKLVDFKLEFGKNCEGQIILGDEITPDTCRIWDSQTGEKLDKDRFRYNLGDVKKGYQKILTLLSS